MARELSEEEEDAQQLRLGGGEEKLFLAAGSNIQESAKSAFKGPTHLLVNSSSQVHPSRSWVCPTASDTLCLQCHAPNISVSLALQSSKSPSAF